MIMLMFITYLIQHAFLGRVLHSRIYTFTLSHSIRIHSRISGDGILLYSPRLCQPFIITHETYLKEMVEIWGRRHTGARNIADEKREKERMEEKKKII